MATVIINSSTAGELNPGFDGTRAPVATAIAQVRTISLSSNLGEPISAQVSYGWDQVAGTARAVFPISTGGLGDPLTISLGAGSNQQRFSGTVYQVDTATWPHAVTCMGKGPLAALEEYRNDIQTVTVDSSIKPGLDFRDLLQGNTTATLQQIVTAILDIVGISYSTSNFDNPDHIYGLDDGDNETWWRNEALVWGTHETASSYMARFLEASAGYRIFDSSDGGIYLKQITATPGNSPGTPGTSDISFTLGVDIFGDTLASSAITGRQNAVLVEGWDDGLGPATSGVVGSGSSAFRVSSPLIETIAFATEIADFWLPQVNRPQHTVRLTTPRDDLIGPGCTINVGGVSDETMWVKSLTTEVAQDASFTQHLVCVVGG